MNDNTGVPVYGTHYVLLLHSAVHENACLSPTPFFFVIIVCCCCSSLLCFAFHAYECSYSYTAVSRCLSVSSPSPRHLVTCPPLKPRMSRIIYHMCLHSSDRGLDFDDEILSESTTALLLYEARRLEQQFDADMIPYMKMLQYLTSASCWLLFSVSCLLPSHSFPRLRYF